MYHITWVIEQIFYINYKWRMIFKNCEDYHFITYLKLIL